MIRLSSRRLAAILDLTRRPLRGALAATLLFPLFTIAQPGASSPGPLLPAPKPASTAPPQQKAALATKSAAIRKPGTAGAKQGCDELAAHPDDKGKVSPGVPDEAIKADLAIEQCALAVEQNPAIARFHFQAGRAYWAAKQYDEALKAFLEAEELDYAPAYFYIGLAYEQGLVKGEEADLAFARDMYMIAASEGFEPAIRAYQDIEEVYDIDYKTFSLPGLMERVYEAKDLAFLSKERPVVLAYFGGVQDFLELNPNEFDPSCGKVADPELAGTITRLLRVEAFALPEQSLSPMDDVARLLRNNQAGSLQQILKNMHSVQELAAARQAGTDDIYALAASYGGCMGAPVTQFYANMKRYLQENPTVPRR